MEFEILKFIGKFDNFVCSADILAGELLRINQKINFCNNIQGRSSEYGF